MGRAKGRVASSNRRTGTVAKSLPRVSRCPGKAEEGAWKERRDFSLHEAAVSSSGNYSAGPAEHGTCVGRSLSAEEEEEDEEEADATRGPNNAAGLRRWKKRKHGTRTGPVISSSCNACCNLRAAASRFNRPLRRRGYVRKSCEDPGIARYHGLLRIKCALSGKIARKLGKRISRIFIALESLGSRR